MVHILTSTNAIIKVMVRSQVTVDSDQLVNAKLGLQQKKILSEASFEEQSQYIDAAAIAAFTALNPIHQKSKFRSNINFQIINSEHFNFTSGSSSSGLGYSLALFMNWWDNILRKEAPNQYSIFATGEVSNTGEVFGVGFVEEKLLSLCSYIESNNKATPFYVCYPYANRNDISKSTLNRLIGLGGKIIRAKCLQEFLTEIIGQSYDGNPIGRWEPFKGLNPYTANDSVRFFGRGQTIEKVMELTENYERPLLFLGGRRSGKTSLIDAGLVPKLKKDAWQVFRVGDITSLSDAYYQVLSSIGKKSEILQNFDKKSFISAELSLTIDKIRSITDSTLESLEKDSGKKLLIIDDIHLAFNSDNRVFKDQFIELLNAVSELGVQVLAFTCREYADFFEEYSVANSLFETLDIDDFSVKETEMLLIKQVEWAGYHFEGSNRCSLSHQIVNDMVKFDAPISIINFCLTKLYDVACIEGTKTISFEHYERLGKLQGVYTTYVIEAVRKNEISDTAIGKLYEMFYDENVSYNMVRLKPFELEDLLNLGLVQYNSHRSSFFGQRLLYETPFYRNWLDNGYRSWFEKIKGAFFQWKELYEQEKGFDDSSLMTDKAKKRIQVVREKYSDAYMTEKKIDNELVLGVTYVTSDLYLGFKDFTKGAQLVRASVISDEDLKIYLYLSERRFIAKTAVRFIYLISAFWIFYAG